MSASVTIGKNTFEEVVIGTQTWMKYDYNFGITGDETMYPDGEFSNVTDYGVQMTWEQAMLIDVPGWHLPTKTEWETLFTYLGGMSTAADALKESGTTYWAEGNNGTNSSGFNSRGSGQNNGNFKLSCRYWSSSEYIEGYPYLYRLLYNSSMVEEFFTSSTTGLFINVRLIKD